MRIGLTYDLRSEYLAEGFGEEETAEFDKEDTIDALDSTLVALGHETTRIGHARALASRLAAGERWDLVFNICEGLHGIAREAQVPALLDIYGIPYTFSDPLVLAVSLHKAWTKVLLAEAGIPTPAFAVFDGEELRRGAGIARFRTDDFPLFVKPLAEGTSKGVDLGSIVRDEPALRKRCEVLFARHHQPVLVESFLPGREVTIGVLGTGPRAEVLGTLEVLLGAHAEQGVYSYLNKEDFETRVSYRLVRPEDDEMVRKAEGLALEAWRVLGGRDAGRLDFRADERGEPQLLEVNPLAGLNPRTSDLPILCGMLGLPYAELVERIVASASERISRSGEGRPAHAHRSSS